MVWYLQSVSEAPSTAKLVQTISPVFGVQTWQEAPTMEKKTAQGIVTKCTIYRESLFLVPVKWVTPLVLCKFWVTPLPYSYFSVSTCLSSLTQ